MTRRVLASMALAAVASALAPAGTAAACGFQQCPVISFVCTATTVSCDRPHLGCFWIDYTIVCV